MKEANVELVEPQTFTINLPSVGAPMAIRTESDEIFVLVRLRLRLRDNVMDVDLDVSTRGDGATVTSLDEDTPAEVGR